ncbi:MAG: orotidine-5'-phosphate decarboxylase [Aestuariivita sp.]|nr:orotidine-5'-phosphate decarboxylase [Aestuariivita sp.]MCY4201326.1 orotidine-5'-phosphate decarboxylase [Aestuariivita sp.]MCY4289451.1 orotidine-5'-phosphate decarboxylase [Aestuariivita sp.]MCY4347342.1 orotidine-5'-phosphate decarboxylase [Aestuariivita sp.]
MSDDRLIVALDVPDFSAGCDLATEIGDVVSFYKVGLGTLSGDGLTLATKLKKDFEKRVFLDLKLFDISATIENAVRQLSNLEFDFLTVHGDPHVVEAAVRGASGSKLKILAVTILTSLDRDDLDASLMRPGSVHDIVLERTARALQAGADGIISSPQEAAKIRQLPLAQDCLIVTPGVRPEGQGANDQKRVATPKEALLAGADHIVIGRPILSSVHPAIAAQEILASLP